MICKIDLEKKYDFFPPQAPVRAQVSQRWVVCIGVYVGAEQTHLSSQKDKALKFIILPGFLPTLILLYHFCKSKIHCYKRMEGGVDGFDPLQM